MTLFYATQLNIKLKKESTMRHIILLLIFFLSSCTTNQTSTYTKNETRKRFIDVVSSCVGGTNSEVGYKIIAKYDSQIKLGFSKSQAQSFALQNFLTLFNENDRLEAYDRVTRCFKNSKTAY